MWDLPDNAISIALTEAFLGAGNPIGVVCHAPSALVNVRQKDGEYLIKNKQVTGQNPASSEPAAKALLSALLTMKGVTGTSRERFRGRV